MKILVIGASGLVGSAVYNFFTNIPGNQVTGTYRNHRPATGNFEHFDHSDSHACGILDKHWDVVVQTAALTNVDLCEQAPEKSYFETVVANRFIVDGIQKSNSDACFILISTDYVFDGKAGPYLEDATTNPINVYGSHKLICEQETLQTFKNGAVLRVTNVFGEEERNKNFMARNIQSILAGERLDLRIPYDQFATPVWSIDIARVTGAIHQFSGKGIFHSAGTDYMNRFQLIEKLRSYCNEDMLHITPISTEEMNPSAKRPLKGGLLNSRLYALDPLFQFSNIDTYLNKYLHDKKH